jgi:polyvinyl alcohol dehydrogenase (cytochrome)
MLQRHSCDRFCDPDPGSKMKSSMYSSNRSILRRALLFTLSVAASTPTGRAQDGAALYHQRCAVCHESKSSDRAPGRNILEQMSPVSIVRTLESGSMREVVGSLTPAERDAIVKYLTGKSPGTPVGDASGTLAGLCNSPLKSFSIDPRAPQWNGWSVDVNNQRFQSASMAGISAAEVAALKLKWAFGFDGDSMAFSQPTIVGGTLFVGSQQGKVFSLNAASGCIQWTFQAEAGVRTAITVSTFRNAKYLAYFGDQRGSVYAVDAGTGRLVWKVRADPHPQTRVTGSPVAWGGRLYVPVSSAEEVASIDPHYQCCQFRGSVIALNAETGTQVWKTYFVDEVPRPIRKGASGTPLWGPSGVAIWSAPTLDPERKVLYVGTGNNYSSPPTSNSDAIVALQMETGKVLWSRQLTPADTYNSSCRTTLENCPETKGPDFDFGSSPILASSPGGHRVLVAGQKSGLVYGLDPDDAGRVLWKVRVGEGGVNGGVQWGSAADSERTYVAVSDVTRTRHETMINGQRLITRTLDPSKGGGVFALGLATGKMVWQTPVPKASCENRPNCSPAQSAAVSLIPGIVFSGALDGHLRAYSTDDGHIVWDFDTVRDFTTINGVAAHGGALDGPGPTIVGGTLFVNSGYGRYGGAPGNVLLAISVDGK